MKANGLLVSGLLAAVAGTWLAGFVGEMKGQPMTISELRVPFLHESAMQANLRHSRSGDCSSSVAVA